MAQLTETSAARPSAGGSLDGATGALGSLNARSELTHSATFASVGFAYPRLVIDNDAYLARCRFALGADPAELARETKMKTRYWCDYEENTWTLAQRAVAMALESAPSLRDEIDVVIVASGTTMPVFHVPHRDNRGVADLAPLLVRELGRDGVLGFDIKAAYCTGFLRGLHVADQMLANPNFRAALVVATEQGSRFAVAESNRSTFCYIMSDAAGAAVLRRTSGEKNAIGLVDHVGWTDAQKFDWVGIGPDAASTIMRGSRAGAATHELLVACGKRLLTRNGLTPRDVDWLLPIQTHARIVEGMRVALEFPEEKLLWAGDVTGFAGSASIAAALAERVRDGTIRPGQLVLSLAVGAGMNCAGALFRA